ncbi:hypothetical protein CXB77_03820 [Chromatium okenii]|uniref:DUF2357 domain-containing protein n=2 Tax=Chromatium okenii TaxID=61644 RepID=A0A2S7XTX3_9GAMM|nr:hypothetical protein CXB77_03820 [Chromatium okenii]
MNVGELHEGDAMSKHENDDVPMFAVYHHDDCVVTVPLDSVMAGAAPACQEMDRLTFEVSPKEPELEYRIQIGDVAPATAIGKAYRRHVEWPGERYLESARGLVDIKLFSRLEHAPAAAWQLRLTLLLAVSASKVTEAVFAAMVGDLASLSSGLLFDLASKSFAGIAKGKPQSRAAVKLPPQSAQLELRVLEALVQEVSCSLLEISRQPEVFLRSERRVATWTGSERLTNDGLSWFVARGIDPRRPSTEGGIVGPRLRIIAHTQCVEHGVIRWFLDLIRERTKDCAGHASAERQRIVADKPYRNHRFGGEASLYEAFDQPKLDKLNEAIARAQRIDRALRGMLELPFLRQQRAIAPREPTPIFRYVLNYHRFWRSMREYLQRSTLLLEHSVDERSKPTWRMYEQWVFLQIAAACEDIGLRPSSHDSLFRRLGSQLFTVDLRRDTQLGFTAADGRRVLLRYEPWIVSRELARRSGDSLFQGREGEVPWSPDVIMEIFDPPVQGKPPQLAHAIVIDAKYTSRIEMHHWEGTSKYQMIRDTESGAQIVRQVWVASPVKPERGAVVRFRDPSVTWSLDGADRPVGTLEFLQGAVAMAADPQSPRGTVCPAAREFITGLLAWLHFPEAQRRFQNDELQIEAAA